MRFQTKLPSTFLRRTTPHGRASSAETTLTFAAQTRQPGWVRLAVFIAVLLALSCCPPLGDRASALTGQERLTPQVSQIQLLPGPLPMHAGRVLPLLYSGNLEPVEHAITAGELWSFFQKQGLTEVQSIVLFLDVEKFSGPEPIQIDSIEFRIEPADSSVPLTSCALAASDSLTIPGDDSLAAAPEARLEIPLDYDFMQRFNAESRERVFLKLAYQAPQGSKPNFFVAGRQDWFTLPSFSLLLGFVAFWGAVFFALFRLTLKSPAPATAAKRLS